MVKKIRRKKNIKSIVPVVTSVIVLLIVLGLGINYLNQYGNKNRPPNNMQVNNATKFFNLINKFENFPNFSSDDVSRILNVPLTENKKEPESYYVVKTAKGDNIAGFFKSIELRNPVDLWTPEGYKGGILIMDLKDDLTITEKDVLDIYPDAIPELKNATPPHTVPYDYMVKKPWGKISYQIPWDNSKRVTTVYIDSVDMPVLR